MRVFFFLRADPKAAAHVVVAMPPHRYLGLRVHPQVKGKPQRYSTGISEVIICVVFLRSDPKAVAHVVVAMPLYRYLSPPSGIRKFKKERYKKKKKKTVYVSTYKCGGIQSK